jgi:hypothetical protein
MDQNNFFSINNLVEFGMGLAIAQQMVKTMNHSIDNMNVPGSLQVNESQSLFYAILDSNQAGPLSYQDISQLVNQKKIVNETYMWKPGMTDWDIAEKIPEILKLVALTPPPIPKK